MLKQQFKALPIQIMTFTAAFQPSLMTYSERLGLLPYTTDMA
jgi:hypothetical protein